VDGRRSAGEARAADGAGGRGEEGLRSAGEARAANGARWARRGGARRARLAGEVRRRGACVRRTPARTR